MVDGAGENATKSSFVDLQFFTYTDVVVVCVHTADVLLHSLSLVCNGDFVAFFLAPPYIS